MRWKVKNGAEADSRLKILPGSWGLGLGRKQARRHMSTLSLRRPTDPLLPGVVCRDLVGRQRGCTGLIQLRKVPRKKTTDNQKELTWTKPFVTGNSDLLAGKIRSKVLNALVLAGKCRNLVFLWLIDGK